MTAAQKTNAEDRAAEKRIAKLASEADVEVVLVELFRESAVAATRGLRKWNRGRTEPSKMTIEATKEARQLAERVEQILVRIGRTTEAERFFTEMETRLAAADLGEGPQPILCPGCARAV